MKETKIQWHPAFVSAMQLEFKEDREKLFFEKEHNLNTKPLQIDLLVIRKKEPWNTGNEIGKLFRKYNIIEYKSPKQQLDIDVFYKTEAYAGLYKSYGKTVDGRKAEDITVSIVRDRKPEKLFRYFAEHGVGMEKAYEGIYYIIDKIPFPTQVIVTKELDREQHTWLRSLSDKMEAVDMRRLLRNASRLQEKLDRAFADSVLEVCLRANRQVVERLKGDDAMSGEALEILEPLVEPIIAEREKEVRKEAKEEGIRDTVILLRGLGHSDGTIKSAIMKQYQLSEEEVNEYM